MIKYTTIKEMLPHCLYIFSAQLFEPDYRLSQNLVYSLCPQWIPQNHTFHFQQLVVSTWWIDTVLG